MTVQRPTWKLGAEIHSGSRAAKDIDLAASTAEALTAETYSTRMNEVLIVEGAAVQYAATCMSDVLVPLALLARERGHITEPGGWEMRVESERNSEICLSVTSKSAPGGWCVSVEVDKKLTDEAAARMTEMNLVITEKLGELGLTPRQIAFRAIGMGGKDIERLPEELELSKFKADPGNYRPVGPDHRFKELRAYAVRLPEGGINGHGRAGGQSDTLHFSSLDIFDVYGNRTGWSSGLAAKLSPAARHYEDDLLKPTTDRDVAMPSKFLQILSNFLQHNGFAPAVREKEAEISQRNWICFGIGNNAALQEVGHGLVHKAGGLWSPEVTAGIRDFSAEIAASDVRMNVSDWIRLARNLEAQGHGRSEARFSCNDGRTESWAVNDGDTLAIFHETQQGKFRTDIQLKDDAPVELHCYRERPGAPLLPIGRFYAGADGRLQQDYAGSVMHDVEVGYTIRNIHGMNDTISALQSMSCVMDDELERSNPQDEGPSP